MGAPGLTGRRALITPTGTIVRGTTLAIAAVAFVFYVAAPVWAQMGSDPTKERYDREKSGNIDDFVEQLDSENAQERLKGVKSLSESTDPKAVEYIVQALGDSDMRVKAKAIDACGNMRATDATPVLIQQLFLRGTDVEVKQRILAALGKIGDRRAAKPIEEFLGRDLDHETRGTAIYALGDIGDADSIEFLAVIERTEPHPTLKRLAREAEAKIRYQQSVRQTEAKQPLDTFLKPDKTPER